MYCPVASSSVVDHTENGEIRYGSRVFDVKKIYNKNIKHTPATSTIALFKVGDFIFKRRSLGDSNDPILIYRLQKLSADL